MSNMARFTTWVVATPGISQDEVGLLGQLLGQGPSPGQQLRLREDFADEAEVLGLLGPDGLSGQQKVASAVQSQQHGINDVHPVAGDQPANEMPGVLKRGVVGGQYDIAQQRDFRMAQRRAVDGADHGDFDVQQIGEQFLPSQ